MEYQKTTHVPNVLFDMYLPKLSFSELKILLYIIRQTYGWKLKNGKRKQRDRISYTLFNQKTGLSRRILSETIQSLIDKELIILTDFIGNKLHSPEQRKGKVGIFYAPNIPRCAESSIKVCKQKHIAVHNRVYNKTNNTKLTKQKSYYSHERMPDWKRIEEIIKLKKLLNNG